LSEKKVRNLFKRTPPQTKYILFNSNLCEACWKCLEACQEKVFGKVDIIFHKHALILNPNACIGCMKCVKVCEAGAIQNKKDHGKKDKNVV
jgi:2-oxoglutarate ferredoxin oxidoreductase subunit delta